MRSDEEIERLLEDWLEAEAHPLRHDVLESILEAVPRVPQDDPRQLGSLRFPSRRMGQLTAAAVLILIVVAGGLAVDRIGPGVFASHAPPAGFTGSWTSLDCATFWEERPDGTHRVDCGLWGDGSTQTLQITRGDTPRVTLHDSHSTGCDNAVGTGTGEYKGIFLFASLSETGCGPFQSGLAVERQLYYDAGSDTLWEDEDGDGFGYVWYRAK